MQNLTQIAIIGTTASGKSALAIELACEFGGVILSLDSLAIYKQIDIASAKPSVDELGLVPHFGINLINPDEEFSAGEFFKIYKSAAEQAKRLNAPLFITGGSGFYLKSMLEGLSPAVPKIAKSDMPSLDEIYATARHVDSEWANKFSPSDSYRLYRWWEIYKFTEEVPSEFLAKNRRPPIIKELEVFDILWQKDELRERIKTRTKQMLEAGLIEEARGLFARYNQNLKSLRSIGLKECGEYLRGEIGSADELSELISTHTAQLAKRQRTFNKGQFKGKFTGTLLECKSAIKCYLG
ncbi:tRNA (adenosine(37)-N6)-dimethylallyltransferase MiaA [Campylobacter sp. 19-13652]|uniref:tRNA (adenosine(37)-N6)-dimethylallyltransferase MiaA n=1 Tax=Campylobacter sp. 19-13652 TaxID=2840180 RepID=UPI001C76EDD9|nr:tRNA (adenosine(37)-N6)-dimethylallyltransferase MiaA [Campylobacter sp. 19-13652]BCX80137.1 tRNA dimethylallyltransferase [Campylobacter sp. 19-13652]